MVRDVVATNGTGLEVPDALAGEGAWKIAQFISDAEGDVRLAKGKFWNACEHGTREKICEHFGWGYSRMAVYGMFAKECNSFSQKKELSFSHWNTASKYGVKKADRPALLEKAADNSWTPKELTDYIKSKSKPKKPTIKITVTPEEAAENKERREREASAGTPPERMSQAKALEILGLSPLTKETLAIVYKGLALKHHPDRGGNENAMKQIIEANTKLQEIT